jgi:hypothetical protein
MTNHSSKKSILKAGIFKIIPPTSLIGIVVGAIGGYIYYSQVVCTTGGCPLTSNPYLTILWGAVMGYLLFDMFNKKKPSETAGGEKNQ